MRNTSRVLLVDGFEPFRRFLRSKLQSRPEFHIVEASDGLEAVQKAGELQPDLILLEVGLPRLNGLEAAHRISQLVPTSTILFISQHNDPDLVSAALSNGARGYVHKQDADTDLFPAVEAVLRGHRFVSAGLGSDEQSSPLH